MPGVKYLVPVTEDELSEWMSHRTWRLPREGVPLDRVNDLARLKPEEVSDDKNDWFLVEYNCSDLKNAGIVPFSSVTSLCGCSDHKTAILLNHYEGFGIEVHTAEMGLQTAFGEWWRRSRIETLSLDCTEGANAMSELFGFGDGVKRGYGRKVAEELVDIELGVEKNNFPGRLLAYSRSQLFGCDGICAAMCDLGTILRSLQKNEKDVAAVNRLASGISSVIKGDQKASLTDCADVLKGSASLKGCSFEFVLFLAWKYAAEHKGGKIDFEQVDLDVKNMRNDPKMSCVLQKALHLFGAYVGFKSFAVQYHIKRRTEVSATC